MRRDGHKRYDTDRLSLAEMQSIIQAHDARERGENFDDLPDALSRDTLPQILASKPDPPQAA